METRNTDKSNEYPNFISLEKRLTAISDITLGVMILAFFQYCDPPQRKFPIGKGEKPVWWPETEPYKEPYNLKKKSKAKVLTAIIENLMPNFSKMEKAMRRSKSLEKAMSSLESYIWSAILTDLKNGRIKSDAMATPVPTSGGPSEPLAEKEMIDKEKREKEKLVEALPNIDPQYRTNPHTVSGQPERSLCLQHPSENNPPQQGLTGGDFVGSGTNEAVIRKCKEGGLNVASLSIANQHPQNSTQNNLLEHQTYDEEFWRFMNNYQK